MCQNCCEAGQAEVEEGVESIARLDTGLVQIMINQDMCSSTDRRLLSFQDLLEPLCVKSDVIVCISYLQAVHS